MSECYGVHGQHGTAMHCVRGIGCGPYWRFGSDSLGSLNPRDILTGLDFCLKGMA